jgi:Fe-S-cluster-containing dehydrogenase component/formate-dependent nitrite reductase membrane component NrfD
MSVDTKSAPLQWAKVIDERRCIGCHACTVACKSENQVPLGVTRTFVKQVETGVFPSVQRHFQVTRCNQCSDAPCVNVCPTAAMFQRPDGIVDFNRDICIGCKACIAACPYDAIYIDPETHSAEKCNFCSHRIDIGLEPSCVVACPTQAIIIGNMNDPESKVSRLIATEKTQVRRPEKNTAPKLFYVQGSEATLDPLASTADQRNYQSAQRRPATATYRKPLQASKQLKDVKSRSGYPEQSAAAAILTYGEDTKVPWDWRVSSYTWTKSIASGTFLVAALQAIFSGGGIGTLGWHVGVAVLSVLFLGLTGAFLVGDLSHPKRFYLILLRPQWSSWLTRGAFIIMGFSLFLCVFIVTAVFGSSTSILSLWWLGLFLATLLAVYTAFLLSQAKGRDMWQNPLLPAHFLAQAFVAGSATLLILDLSPGGIASIDRFWLQWAFTLSLGANLFLGLSDLLIPHSTRHAARAMETMIRGRWRRHFWTGNVLAALALVLMIIAFTLTPVMVAAPVMSLLGLWLTEHAYIQAGQSVPQS